MPQQRRRLAALDDAAVLGLETAQRRDQASAGWRASSESSAGDAMTAGPATARIARFIGIKQRARTMPAAYGGTLEK